MENGTRAHLPVGQRFLDAVALAAEVHRHQARKGTQIPYVSHVLGVAAIALEHGADEDEAVAALLHDSIEDAPDSLGPDPAQIVRASIEFKFGRRVLDIVEACSDTDVRPKPPWRQRKEQYVARIASENASVLLVSASDKLHNARAILSDYRVIGHEVFARFNRDAGIDGTVGYYRGLVDAFLTRAAQLSDQRLHRLIAELRRTVAELERDTGVAGRWPVSNRT